MKFFLCVVGMVMIVEGLPYFAFPDKMKQMIQMVTGMEDESLRRVGFFLMLIGFIVVYFSAKGQ